MNVISRIFGAIFGHREGGAPERLPPPDSLALAARPSSEPEAQFMREVLRSNGIESMVKNRDAASAQAGGAGPAWAYEVWVLRRDLRQALELLGTADDET
jgi:hypothetical protein